MIQKVLTGWTFARGIYLVLGLIVVVQSVVQEQWVGAIFGSYFAAMGLFAFGCAAGNCFGGDCKVQSKSKAPVNIKDINFEEVK